MPKANYCPLLPAVDAVLRSKQFVSSSLKGHESTDTSGEKIPRRHEVLFYSDDTLFLDSFARFIAVALKAGDAAIVVATESHREALAMRLKTQGVNVDAATQDIHSIGCCQDALHIHGQ